MSKTITTSLTLISAVAAMGQRASADTLTINGADLYYEAIGEGPPLLIMHGGLGLSHDYLRPYFDVLAESHTVVFYDHFGNGQSETPTDYAEMTFDRLTSDAAALMEALGHDQFGLIGHSYGGFIAQAFATGPEADHLTKLVLIDTVPAFDYAPTVSGSDEQMASFGKLFSQPMADNTDWQDTWGVVVQIYFHDYDADIGADLDSRTHYNYAAWNASGALLATFNMTEALADVAVPTLAIAGAHDGITPPGPGAERIASTVPGAELMIFENAGHYPFIEDEAAFFAALTDWLATN